MARTASVLHGKNMSRTQHADSKKLFFGRMLNLPGPTLCENQVALRPTVLKILAVKVGNDFALQNNLIGLEVLVPRGGDLGVLGGRPPKI